MFSTNRVKGKIALITGATSGIGKSCAIALAKLGMNLIITGRRENLLIELKKELEEKFSVQVLAIQLDVRNADEVKDKLSSISDEWKNIDILINNAGLAAGLDKLYHNSTEDISNVIDTNIKGLLYVTNAIVPHMIERDVPATIINIGSVAGDAAYAGGAVYCASKAAVKILSDGLRIDLVDTKIKVTDVKPGLVETNFSLVRFKGDEERAKKVYQGVEPLTPDDVAETVAYIANLPDNVHIAEITLLCNNQADGRTIYKK
ncbi:SDR family NAD(P)-dependent oxidoreductase [uncultured Fusobacterium sp.]|uniref:SDR family NAD(P)-dependent oxidoreductase n=1 Tax=uncultured Fusobacterium sp. TaxID=159267 RepID=UPI0025D96CCF|nr:SDR family NAD(P)-dependent oxidoreductase [uncultured Fusobacterium sp.]